MLEVTEQVLAVAPQHVEARRARARAWQAIEPATVAARPRPNETVLETPPSANGDAPQRFFLWVDGVGGYLVCLGAHVTLGQASPNAHVDLPLVADVSRLHATLTRDGEGGYLLEATRPILVNGQATNKAVLRPGDRVTLGASCQLQFQRPVPVSSTARLDLASGHRLLPGVDAVLLMGDTLVLGRRPQCHVEVPELKKPLVLYRSKDSLGVKYASGFTVDGHRQQDRALLGSGSHVSGDEFAFALEAVLV